MKAEGSLTADYLSGRRRIEVPEKRRKPRRGSLKLTGATENNLHNVTLEVPFGTLTVVTGVSGSGKSSLVTDTLAPALANRVNHAHRRTGAYKKITGLDKIDKVINIDQSPIGRTPRSNPATYIGLWDDIRALFASTQESKARGYSPGRFSFNVNGGRCEACKGDGQIKIEMHFLPDIYVPCEVCGGDRYNRETLQVTYRGKNIAEVLDMTVEERWRALPGINKCRRCSSGPGLHPPGAAGHHAVRRRGAAREACQRAAAPPDRQDVLHPGRAHHRPALRGRAPAAHRVAAPGGRGQHRAGHRAQPRRHQVRRPHRRPRPRGRRARRHRGGPGHARGGRPGGGQLHRRLREEDAGGRPAVGNAGRGIFSTACWCFAAISRNPLYRVGGTCDNARFADGGESMREEGSIQVAETVAGNRHVVRGIVCALAGGICWGFSGTCAQLLMNDYGAPATWI
ncbi:MAG: hypothetical protein ACLU0V_06965, partial [Eggerthella lenta]